MPAKPTGERKHMGTGISIEIVRGGFVAKYGRYHHEQRVFADDDAEGLFAWIREYVEAR